MPSRFKGRNAKLQFRETRGMALPLLRESMISDLSSVQAELHTTRQIRVRFAHAPRVKLTLAMRASTSGASQPGRVLRLVRYPALSAPIIRSAVSAGL